MLRFARSRPTQATSVDDVTVEVAAVRDGHVGRAAGNATDAEGLASVGRAAAVAAEAAARSASGHGSFPGFPAVSPPRPNDGHDPATATLDPERGGSALGDGDRGRPRRGRRGRRNLDGGRGARRTVVSTAGADATERVTDAFMKVVATAPLGAHRLRGADRRRLRGARRRSAGAARRGEGDGERSALEAEPGEYPVVLEPHAVAELLWVAGARRPSTAWRTRRAAARWRTDSAPGWCPRRSTSPTRRDTGRRCRGHSTPRVLPKAPLPLIQDGVASGVVHHTRSAALAGAESTGHARVAAGSGRALATNLVMAGGGAADEAELCARHRARDLRDPALVHERPAPGGVAVHGRHPRRHLPDRGRQGHTPGGRHAGDRQRRWRSSPSRRRWARDVGADLGRRALRTPVRDGTVCPPLRARGVRLHGIRRVAARSRSSAARSRSPRTASANATVQRLRLRSTSEPPPSGPAPPPTPKAPERPVSLPECSRIEHDEEHRRG